MVARAVLLPSVYNYISTLYEMGRPLQYIYSTV